MSKQRQRAVDLLAREIGRGGHMRVCVPTGCGKSEILARAIAAKVADGTKVAFVSRNPTMREQMRRIATRIGVTMTYVTQRDDLSAYDVVVVSEELRNVHIEHPNIVQL